MRREMEQTVYDSRANEQVYPEPPAYQSSFSPN